MLGFSKGFSPALRGGNVKRRSALLGLVLLGVPASADVLYEIDFETPPHVVGSLPEVGLGPPPRAVPSTIWSGAPTIVASMAGLAQCLRFDSFCCPWGQDEIILFFSSLPDFPFYRAGFTVTIEDIETGARFGVIFENPLGYHIHFTWENSVGGIVSAGFAQAIVPIGVWEPLTPLRVTVDMWMGGDWTIYLDGTPVYTGSFGGTDLKLLWFVTASGSVAAGLDDVRVWGGDGPVRVENGTWASIKALYR